MEVNQSGGPFPDQSGGYSVVLSEKVLDMAQVLEIDKLWTALRFGNCSRRRTAYTSEQRIAAVMAGLACGLRGVAPGNLWLRPNTAMQQRLRGRFPDQGTIHRWLGQVTQDQAADLRHHLHEVVRVHGRFWNEIWSTRLLIVDLDGQGLIARGRRFEHAKTGYMGGALDQGYQRYVCYAGETAEVLDELLTSGNRTAMSVLPEMLQGLNEVIPRSYRDRVLLRGDAHFGTAANLYQMRKAGYHYLCPLFNCWSKKKLKEQVRGCKGGWVEIADSTGQVHRFQFWRVRRLTLRAKRKRGEVRPRATLYCERNADGEESWTVLLTDLKRMSAARMWQEYQQRNGTIEEYNDQSERAYHLDVMRTGNFAGLNALQCLVGLCWNLTRWATEELRLPPVLAPNADPTVWIAAAGIDMDQLMQRARHSGLRLYRESPCSTLEVENSAASAESEAWLRFLQQPVQRRLRLAG
jgi:Transposase DDE domain